ncbi:Anthranilate/para-aminobenzoate synthase component I TrpE [Methanonatronarchaeum thermophilum]|uniref:Anthranilate synthase component 1 n=1 Tax=Methanonatronarchaeum thermophilum TaxID=1927129 RepID=A0A1Y3GDT6_9EURY|nr:anthranilate synthase component I [Methanonatronarchaeum thermophilum]OUJ19420.1 Anthranilate/para-aminobenzoate synthase component I TrpE [Methanonatronarchaeum thermophilum]
MFVDSEYKNKKTEKNNKKPKLTPVVIKKPIPKNKPRDIYQKLNNGPGFLLESREGKEKLSRFSFIGIEPIIKIKITNKDTKIEGKQEYLSAIKINEQKTAIDKIHKLTQCFNYIESEIPRFDGGALGYFTYDITEELHKTLKTPKQKTLAEFMVCKKYLIFDHKKDTLYIAEITLENENKTKTKQKLKKLHKNIKNYKPNTTELQKTPIQYKSNTTRQEYINAVKKTKKHIKNGEIFQAVISRRLDIKYQGNPFNIYIALDKINPSPYMYYLDYGDHQVIGSSPEMLVRVQKNKLMTVPIAGTRKRGKTKQKDQKLAKELLNDEKEMAEHIMLVDLARNDIGQVSKFGTVKVNEFAEIEKFSHVQHITSKVEGELKDNLNSSDVLKSCFPAGTVSGAPKLRAMQIIQQLEPEKRGVYSGAVGYIGFNGNMDFAIAIRTILTKNNTASLQLGAGIVNDSKPAREWEETKEKGQAGLEAIKMAGEKQ